MRFECICDCMPVVGSRTTYEPTPGGRVTFNGRSRTSDGGVEDGSSSASQREQDVYTAIVESFRRSLYHVVIDQRIQVASYVGAEDLDFRVHRTSAVLETGPSELHSLGWKRRNETNDPGLRGKRRSDPGQVGALLGDEHNRSNAWRRGLVADRCELDFGLLGYEVGYGFEQIRLEDDEIETAPGKLDDLLPCPREQPCIYAKLSVSVIEAFLYLRIIPLGDKCDLTWSGTESQGDECNRDGSQYRRSSDERTDSCSAA